MHVINEVGILPGTWTIEQLYIKLVALSDLLVAMKFENFDCNKKYYSIAKQVANANSLQFILQIMKANLPQKIQPTLLHYNQSNLEGMFKDYKPKRTMDQYHARIRPTPKGMATFAAKFDYSDTFRPLDSDDELMEEDHAMEKIRTSDEITEQDVVENEDGYDINFGSKLGQEVSKILDKTTILEPRKRPKIEAPEFETSGFRISTDLNSLFSKK